MSSPAGDHRRGQGRADLRLYRTIVPQMVLWLPEDEAAQIRFAFDSEVERLLAA